MSGNWNGTLRKCSLGGFEFPVVHCRMDFSQDIVQHRYPNVPGAQIESMSRNPLVFEVRALFLTGLKGFTNDLFPQTFQNVLRVLNDDLNETTKFVHPTLGKFNVKVVHGTTETTYEITNGQIIDFSLIEDGNNDAVRQDNILGVDEVSAATQSATSLDSNLTTYVLDTNASISLPNVPSTGNTTFSSLLSGALAPTTQSSIASSTASYTAADAISQINITKAQLFNLNDANTSYMMSSMEVIESALNDQRCNNNTNNIYTVKTQQTLSQVMKYLLQYNDKLSIETLISLNPQLSLSSLLTVGTVIYWS